MGFRTKLGLRKYRDGRSKHVLYKHWKHMMEASYDQGRDYKVDPQWHDFWNFVTDTLPMYESRKGNIFCRIDASKDWMIGNAWFVKDMHTAAWGRAGTYHIELDGKLVSTRYAKKILQGKGLNVSEQTIRDRARKKQDISGKKYQFNHLNFTAK